MLTRENICEDNVVYTGSNEVICSATPRNVPGLELELGLTRSVTGILPAVKLGQLDEHVSGLLVTALT